MSDLQLVVDNTLETGHQSTPEYSVLRVCISDCPTRGMVVLVTRTQNIFSKANVRIPQTRNNMFQHSLSMHEGYTRTFGRDAT